jgi:hypothetical protein
MSSASFAGLRIAATTPAPNRRRYSVTSDILSYQRCARQYGFFAVRGYEPAYAVQIYYGTVIHQVLDRAHGHFQGRYDPDTRNQIPTDNDIDRYFDEVDRALRARGVRAVNRLQSEAARRRLKLFNQIEGPGLYPRVRDTEHRLQRDQGEYLLHGTVDVLADDPRWSPGMAAEIWDYKGGSRPNPNGQDFRRYEFQMLVYAELYRERNGSYPSRAILYFLGELDAAQLNPIRPSDALIEVPLDQRRIQVALEEFRDTVADIENSRRTAVWPAPDPMRAPDTQTCDICDLRWNCPTVGRRYPVRVP